MSAENLSERGRLLMMSFLPARADHRTVDHTWSFAPWTDCLPSPSVFLIFCELLIDQDIVILMYNRSRFMDTVTLSPKFQVVIPKRIRERLKLRAGQKIQAIAYDDRIELVPVRPVRSMRGFVKGIDTTVAREDDRL